MSRWLRLAAVSAVAVVYLSAVPASAQQLFEDFGSYNLGSLDKNDPNGPNMADNGTGNPWFGPEINFPNCYVVGPENGVQPISSGQMIRGRAPGDFDQDWLNIAYRFNGGSPLVENLILDWYFYDPLGPGGSDYRDYLALGYYDTAPTDNDGPPSYNLNPGVGLIQRMSLGATSNLTGDFDPTVYQARIVGATDGYNGAGWFNTATPRSIGWHHALIAVGPMLDDGTADVMFFIDDMDNETLEHNSATNYGYNVIEVNADYGAATGYFDDITFNSLD